MAGGIAAGLSPAYFSGGEYQIKQIAEPGIAYVTPPELKEWALKQFEPSVSSDPAQQFLDKQELPDMFWKEIEVPLVAIAVQNVFHVDGHYTFTLQVRVHDVLPEGNSGFQLQREQALISSRVRRGAGKLALFPTPIRSISLCTIYSSRTQNVPGIIQLANKTIPLTITLEAVSPL
jgi:hypothetical protein